MKSPPLIDDLEKKPTGFDFAQAVSFTKKWLDKKNGGNSWNLLQFKVNPNLSFPPSDITSLKIEEKSETTSAEMVMNLMGLHGAASPLPAYFTEHVAQHQDEAAPLRDFFDLFNHRLIQIMFESWFKYRYYAQFTEGATDRLSSTFFSFLGLGHHSLRQTQELDLVKLLPYMGLIAFSGEATGSLESILRHYFAHREVFITPCIKRYVQIAPDQKTKLGEANSTLADDCLIGESVPDQTSKFRISLINLSWVIFNEFLPLGGKFSMLKSLILFVLKSQVCFDMELRLRPEEVPPLALSHDSECRLAWSAWLGDGADGIVLIETS